MKKYLVLVTNYLSDLALLCEAGSIVLLPADYELPETKENYPKKFKFLGEVEGTDKGIDPELAEVHQVLNAAGVPQAVAGTYFKEVGAVSPEEKLEAARELAQEYMVDPSKQPAKAKPAKAKG